MKVEFIEIKRMGEERENGRQRDAEREGRERKERDRGKESCLLREINDRKEESGSR